MRSCGGYRDTIIPRTKTLFVQWLAQRFPGFSQQRDRSAHHSHGYISIETTNCDSVIGCSDFLKTVFLAHFRKRLFVLWQKSHIDNRRLVPKFIDYLTALTLSKLYGLNNISCKVIFLKWQAFNYCSSPMGSTAWFLH